MSSIGGGSSFIPKGLGQIQGAEKAQETNEVKTTKGPDASKADSTKDTFGIVDGAQVTETGLSETLGPPGSGNSRTDGASLGGKAGFLSEVSDGALMFSAMMEMARVSQREMSDARDLKSAMHQGKIQAKKDGIEALKDQQQAERDSAALKLGMAVATTVVSAIAGAAGANSGVVNSISQLGNQAVTFGDKQWGFQREADDKKVEQKQHERTEAIFDDSIDSAKNTYEEAKEQFKSALRIISETAERRSNEVSKITQG